MITMYIVPTSLSHQGRLWLERDATAGVQFDLTGAGEALSFSLSLTRRDVRDREPDSFLTSLPSTSAH